MSERRMHKALPLPLRMIAGRVLSAASARMLRFGAQTSRPGGVLHGAGLAILLLLGAVLLPAVPALAQNPIISNLGEAESTSSIISDSAANAFTTGSRTGGYILTEVVIRFANSSGVPTSFIYDAFGNAPGASIGTLAGPATIPAAGVYTFTSSVGITLAASTTYYLVFSPADPSVHFSATTSTNQITADNWDIINGILLKLPTMWIAINPMAAFHFSLSVLPPLSFGSNTIPHQTYTAGTAITDLTLPAASGSGIGINSYTLEPDPPDGLSFNGNSNPPVLSGKPTTVMAAASYTYTATVASSNTSLNFTIRVLPPDAVKLRLRVFLEGPLE